GWVTKRRSAALEKLRVMASATKSSSHLVSRFMRSRPCTTDQEKSHQGYAVCAWASKLMALVPNRPQPLRYGASAGITCIAITCHGHAGKVGSIGRHVERTPTPDLSCATSADLEYMTCAPTHAR